VNGKSNYLTSSSKADGEPPFLFNILSLIYPNHQLSLVGRLGLQRSHPQLEIV
jgi:hypothetical protein